jgi:hypothetical protein
MAVNQRVARRHEANIADAEWDRRSVDVERPRTRSQASGTRMYGGPVPAQSGARWTRRTTRPPLCIYFFRLASRDKKRKRA